MAEACDVEVLGVTLSSNQQSLATVRARERGLQGQVRFELQDYRNVTGPFDRIVSIGILEHVGVDHHREFFDKVSSLLHNDGVARVEIGDVVAEKAVFELFERVHGVPCTRKVPADAGQQTLMLVETFRYFPPQIGSA